MSNVRTDNAGQWKEWGVLVGLYSLSSFNAEMLRRAAGSDRSLQTADSLFAEAARLISDHIHPVMMVIGIGWLLAMAIRLGQGHQLKQWIFDIPAFWFCLRLIAEFLIINGLIFQPSLVQPGVLLGQIVVFLPFFVISWGWILHRLDWIDREQPGTVVQLTDIAPGAQASRFDYFHSTINTLINKGKPSIIGVSRKGRIVVLCFNAMLLCLYAVAFTRILQLTKATL